MNAKEAKIKTDKVIENTSINNVLDKINKAIEIGRYACVIEVLSESEIEKLLSDGYRVRGNNLGYYISWDVML